MKEQSVTISLILDEMDGDPVWEVKSSNGNATNATTLEQALELAKADALTFRMPHKVTSEDFAEGHNGDLLYIGPFAAAQKMIKDEGEWSIELDPKHNVYRLFIMDNNGWGVGDTEELAWRYAIASEFGPLDDEFKPFYLPVI